ncbi:TIGR02677 family protein [Sporosarcina sp. NCCP-2716]|uniref:TIGR02677 family protein n=1 Tax=Sporosarcina sp. NCCP-2716 TaxID=2943679 RepID=UPI00203D5ECC|nr:TIGR02677 family protein [Sporosarcina sp. NCCP-2716]GKV69729.1 TIGR02677 family protein [Sporosarcina sp. NCCP-2716]
MDQKMRKIVEASYLTADSAAHYRTILRFFFHQHERMRDYIPPEEILVHMRSHAEFGDYSEELLHQQLAQLVKWNNLAARQDMTSAKTIEEYKKKRFRYQCTPLTVEIERMLIQLEKIGENFQGSLERSQFDRLLQSLASLQKEIGGELRQPAEEYMRMWEDIFRYFQTIRASTADYIAYINSEETTQRMQTDAFLIYKNQFTAYLRDFIISLQKTSLQIQQRLLEIGAADLELFFGKLAEHRRAIPRLEDASLSEENWLVEYREYWSSLRQWFLGTDSQESELVMLQWQTNEMIRRMTRYVQRIGERQQHFRSRKKDYLHLAKWFTDCLDLEEAHRLSSVVFGSMTVAQIQLERFGTDNLHTDVWEDEPEQLVIKPRTNRYREKTKPSGFKSNAKQKQELREAYLEQRRQEKHLLDTYVDQGKIVLSATGTVEPFVRKVLLGWIGKSMANEQRIVKTDYGQRVRVTLDPTKEVTLSSEDGKLTMPDAIFEFMTEG